MSTPGSIFFPFNLGASGPHPKPEAPLLKRPVHTQTTHAFVDDVSYGTNDIAKLQFLVLSNFRDDHLTARFFRNIHIVLLSSFDQTEPANLLDHSPVSFPVFLVLKWVCLMRVKLWLPHDPCIQQNSICLCHA